MLRRCLLGVVAAVSLAIPTVFSSDAPLAPPTSPSNGATPQEKAAPDPRLKEMLASPRATMSSFLDLMDAGDRSAAAECLDLSDLSGEARAAKAWRDRCGRRRY